MLSSLEMYEAANLFTLQIAGLISIIVLAIVEPSYLLISFAVYFFTGCIGMSMTYHRGLAHRSWKMPRWFEIFGTLCATYGLTGSSIAWVATHRKHHRHTDKEKDPHSPIYSGWAPVQFFSMFTPVEPKHAINLMRDPFHVALHRYYWFFHLFVILTILYFGGVMMLAAAYLAPAAILWHAGSAVNSLNHLSGYRNHDTDDNSHNNLITGYLVWGEGWHNNHHNRPTMSKFGEKWWELDIGGMLLALFRG